MNFSYKIPLSLCVVVLGGCFVVMLGAYGFFDDSFKANLRTQVTTTLLFLVAASYLAISPRDRRVQLSDTGITLHSVLLSPFKSVSFSWDDVVDVQISSEELIFVTRRGRYKLSQWLCWDDFEFSMTPRNYLRARDWAQGQWTDIRRERKLRRWHLQNQRRLNRDA